MANTLGLDFATDIAETASDVPSTLVWSSQTVTGTRSPENQQSDRTEEYDFTRFDCEWSGVLADFTDSTLPEMHDVVTVDGVAYYVEGYAKHGDDLCGVLRLRRVE